jgi:POT family proton-dependent oligopeptide transporter
MLGGHPPGLAVLFFSEMWERFSFYGMRALLVLYMVEQVLLPGHAQKILGYGALVSGLHSVFGELSTQAIASQIYGIYTSLLFLTPLFGGILADRWLGQYRTVQLGGIVMAIGHFLMAFDFSFLIALLCIIFGNGCFKPNISSQVGGLYVPGDNKRDSAFSLFYVGINLGALIAPVVCGTLGEVYGWHWGFLAAGIGMVAGLVIFTLGRRHLPADVRPRAERSRATAPKARLRRRDVQAIVALCLIAFIMTFFWASYEQQGNAVVLWARDYTDRSFFGLFDIKVTWFQSMNPLLIFVLTPVVLYVWARQARKRREPGVVTKLAIGCFLGSIAYAILTLAALSTGGSGRASWIWTLAYFIALTFGELFVAPVALSLYSRAAPAAVASTMMGVWFLSAVIGNYLTGLFGSYWERLPKPVFWAGMAVVSFGAGLAVLACKRLLDRILVNSEMASSAEILPQTADKAPAR